MFNMATNFKSFLKRIPVPRQFAVGAIEWLKLDEFFYRKNIGKYRSFSQAYQDVFIFEMLEGKRGGVYVEIGANSPIGNSNTFCLEKYYDWTGVSFEIDMPMVERFNSMRRNKCIGTDATTFDYSGYLERNFFPRQIDYLQLDIEPANNTYAALTKLPLDDFRFSVITYEHDNYAYGDEYMHKSRELLRSHGYKLIVPNVSFGGMDFEDWWIDPSVVPERCYAKYVTKDPVNCEDVFRF